MISIRPSSDIYFGIGLVCCIVFVENTQLCVKNADLVDLDFINRTFVAGTNGGRSTGYTQANVVLTLEECCACFGLL